MMNACGKTCEQFHDKGCRADKVKLLKEVTHSYGKALHPLLQMSVLSFLFLQGKVCLEVFPFNF